MANSDLAPRSLYLFLLQITLCTLSFYGCNTNISYNANPSKADPVAPIEENSTGPIPAQLTDSTYLDTSGDVPVLKMTPAAARALQLAARPDRKDLTDVAEIQLKIKGQDAIGRTTIVASGEEIPVEASVRVTERLAHTYQWKDHLGAPRSPYVSVNTVLAFRPEGQVDWPVQRLSDLDVIPMLNTQPNDLLKAAGGLQSPFSLKEGNYSFRLYMSFYLDGARRENRWIAEGRLMVVGIDDQAGAEFKLKGSQ